MNCGFASVLYVDIESWTEVRRVLVNILFNSTSGLWGFNLRSEKVLIAQEKRPAIKRACRYFKSIC